jgi:UDP-glucose 4-epimerase
LKVLVTGAAGYIGQHLCLGLQQSGIMVHGFSRSEKPSMMAGVEWIVGDISDTEMIASAVTGCPKVVHMACLPMAESKKDPLEADLVNSVGTVRLLYAAVKAGVEKMIYTSTGQVYGGQAELPNREDQYENPVSAYAISKLHGEHWCEFYSNWYQFPVTTLRLFNIYGAAVDGSARPTVESIFIQNIQAGKRLKISGNQKTGRDFIHIRDVIRAIQLTLEVPVTPGLVNIGTGIMTTLPDLARMIGHLLGREDLESYPFDTGEPPIRFQADIVTAQRDLGFIAEVSLEDGLKIQCNIRNEQS